MKSKHAWIRKVKVGDLVRIVKNPRYYGRQFIPGKTYRVEDIDIDLLNDCTDSALQMGEIVMLEEDEGGDSWWVETCDLEPTSECYQCIYECVNNIKCELFTPEMRGSRKK